MLLIADCPDSTCHFSLDLSNNNLNFSTFTSLLCCRWFYRHFAPVFGGRPTVLVTNAGTGTEMVTALTYGLNVIGVDSARTMIECAKKRLTQTVNALSLRKDLAAVPLDDLVKCAVTALPSVKLATPQKRRVTLINNDDMPSLFRLYHVMVNLPWTWPAGARKPVKPSTLKAGLRLHMM